MVSIYKLKLDIGMSFLIVNGETIIYITTATNKFIF